MKDIDITIWNKRSIRPMYSVRMPVTKDDMLRLRIEIEPQTSRTRVIDPRNSPRASIRFSIGAYRLTPALWPIPTVYEPMQTE
jgi:hypothetical protein